MKWSEPGNPSKEPKKLILFKKGDIYPVSRKATLLCTSDSLEIELFYEEPTNIDKNVQIQTCIVKDLKGTVENPARLFVILFCILVNSFLSSKLLKLASINLKMLYLKCVIQFVQFPENKFFKIQDTIHFFKYTKFKNALSKICLISTK